MLTFLGLLAGGLALSGYLIHRQHQRVTTSHSLPAGSRQPMNVWQQGITLDLRTDYTGKDPAQRRLLDGLRREELRQRPQEGRN